MGIVSADLQRNYHIGGDVLSCVVSGFFDSIGVYQKPDHAQVQQARRWLAWIGLDQQRAQPFKGLSFADQRLVLIARALIKAPPLLILDEPTQGLDESNRTAVLDFIESVAARGITTIVYVSHRRDEQRSFFVQHLDMDQFAVEG
jgi:molybdate transport system ATP-binding protein